ncbi:MAG: hypothetical protein ACXAEN_21895 [Candidatus Thorarchaeota archaeon]|jgi:hypothetical protein
MSQEDEEKWTWHQYERGSSEGVQGLGTASVCGEVDPDRVVLYDSNNRPIIREKLFKRIGFNRVCLRCNHPGCEGTHQKEVVE